MPDQTAGTNSTRLVFMGSPEFAVPSLERLLQGGLTIVAVYTQPDRPAGRGRHMQPPPVKQAALEAGLRVYQPESLRTAESVAELASQHPDAIVVVAFGQILRRPVLEIPAQGVLNVHASLLPRHRGASPVTGALLAGDESAGVSIMLLDEGLDTGPVLARRAEPILPEDTAGSLSDRLANLGAELLLETLPAWLAGRIAPSPQDEALATLTRRVNKDAGQIDWNLSARNIWSRIRAYTPWPGAMTNLGGIPLQILQGWPIASGSGEPAGTVVPLALPIELPASLPSPAFGVQTGDGILLPLMLKRAGKRALNAREFLNGERGLTGRSFGP